jgi:hypothetical protein
MHYLTKKQVIKLLGVTRQAVEERIRRETLPTIRKNAKVNMVLYGVSDTEYEKNKQNLNGEPCFPERIVL